MSREGPGELIRAGAGALLGRGTSILRGTADGAIFRLGRSAGAARPGRTAGEAFRLGRSAGIDRLRIFGETSGVTARGGTVVTFSAFGPARLLRLGRISGVFRPVRGAGVPTADRFSIPAAPPDNPGIATVSPPRFGRIPELRFPREGAPPIAGLSPAEGVFPPPMIEEFPLLRSGRIPELRFPREGAPPTAGLSPAEGAFPPPMIEGFPPRSGRIPELRFPRPPRSGRPGRDSIPPAAGVSPGSGVLPRFGRALPLFSAAGEPAPDAASAGVSPPFRPGHMDSK